MKKTKILTTAMATLLLAGCAEEVGVDRPADSGGLTFVATIDDSWGDTLLTRGMALQQATEAVLIDSSKQEPLYLLTEVAPRSTATAMTRSKLINYVSPDLMALGSFGVSGYQYDPTASKNYTDVNANFMYNAKVQLTTGEEWKTTQPYYIPSGNDRLAFFAYLPYASPFGTSGVTDITGDDAAETGPMVVSYTVNSDIEQQADLMTAYTVNQKFAPGAGVTLKFRHALTAINFVLSDEVSTEWNIKDISLCNVINHANYKVGTGWLKGGETRSTFTLDLTKQSANGKPLTDSNRSLNTEAQTFLMIPQSFTDDDDLQRFTVTLYNPTTARTKTLHHALKGTVWTEGTVVTYSISTSSVNVVTPNIIWPASWDGEQVLTEENFQDDDKVGVYAVDINTKKVTQENVLVRYDASTGKWLTEGDDELKFKSTCDYYAYYPYKATLTGARTLGSTYTGSSATDFFSDVITGWTPTTGDQSTRELFTANDLQVGMGITDDDGIFGHLKFPMQHAMGLAVIELESKTVIGTVRYFANDAQMETSAYYDIPDIEMKVTASSEFAGGTPACYINYNKCFYVVKKGSEPTFNSVSGQYNSWVSPVQVTVAANGKKGTGLAKLPDMPDNKYIFRGRYFTCTQTPQTYVLPISGTYRMDCWGASGGNSYRVYTGTAPTGGRGAYVSGAITLGTGTLSQIYVYVGYGGVTGDAATAVTFNGGGGGSSGSESTTNTRGGGATDFRLVGGAWNDAIGLRSRIIVAGGGSGAENYGTTSNHTWPVALSGCGGAAGGLEGYSGSTSYDLSRHSNNNMATYKTEAGGGTQTAGGTRWYLASAGDPNRFMPSDWRNCVTGLFGCGGSASSVGYVQGGSRYVCGGGGGYYGGASGSIISHAVASGGGGSSFISGHEGCDAIQDATGEVHTGQPNHYSGCIFTNTEMIDGQGYKWTTTKGAQVNMLPPNSSTTKITGNSGAGYARIATPIVIGYN